MNSALEILLVLLGFVILGGLCFVVMVVGMLWRDGRRYNQEHDLP